MTDRNNKVLVVDQDEFLVRIYVSKLELAGFDPYFTTDVSMVEGIMAEAKPSAVIYEPLMSGGAGFELLSKLKADSAAPFVIILTMLGESEDVAMGLKLGADAYMIKTQTAFKDVIEKLHQLLG